MREGAEIVNEAGEQVGEISSGGFGPSVGGPVAMGYVQVTALNDVSLFSKVRNKLLPLEVRRKGPVAAAAATLTLHRWPSHPPRASRRRRQGNEERRKDKGFTGVSRDSASIARESGSMQGV